MRWENRATKDISMKISPMSGALNLCAKTYRDKSLIASMITASNFSLLSFLQIFLNSGTVKKFATISFVIINICLHDSICEIFHLASL
ncbi:hypothetical protein X777_02228 [Ooceraea biroi]|uniref:Uncharacterized protein n=1 Tax=Ooceraea biroi TaxID=2015173 RepID=A0A026WNG6_OOCBI|nr:hypothetical protein X777_02228 [Ooceraea biroi]